MPATYTVAVDWAGDGTYTGAGDDITARTLHRTGVTIRYGRDQARPYAPTAPGRAQLEVDNASRDYSPENTSSPLAGLVLPGRSVDITATLGVTTYSLYRGRLDDYEVLPGIADRSVALTCLDGLGLLRGVTVSTPLYRGITTGQAIGYLLDEVGWPDDARDLDRGATVMPWWWVDGDASDAVQQLVDSEGPGSLATIGPDGTFTFRDRHHRITRAASLTSQATWSDSGAEPLFSAMTYDHGWKEITNYVVVDVPVRAVGSLATVWSMDGNTLIADGETAAVDISATDPFIGAIPPVAGTDFTLRSGAVSVSLSRDSGQSCVIYLTASGGPAVVADLSLRAKPVTVDSTVRVHSIDSASSDTYGLRSWPAERLPVWAGQWDAQAIADIIVATYARRLPAVSLTFTGGDDTRLAQQLGRDLSDRVTIVDTQTGLHADFWVEQIQHKITADSHATTFGCVRVPTQPVNVLILDSGTLDVCVLGREGLDDPDLVLRLDSGQIGANLLGY